MTENSFLCNYIKEHPYDWKEKLENFPYFLKIKEDNGLFIFNYDMLAEEAIEDGDEGSFIAKTDFSLPIVQEARGIIINPENQEVVCWPFRKFGNYGESYVDNIDWNTARVQDKIDGSIIKVWFNGKENKWMVSSNSVIDAHSIQNGMGVNFGNLFDVAAKGVLDYSRLDEDKTYIFELVSPKSKVVINYPETKIYHIGTRSNLTGLESNDNIGVEKPKEYKINNLDDCIKAAAKLNTEKERCSKFDVEFEGFVVVDNHYNRIKVKSPEYLIAHHSINNGVLSWDGLLKLIEENETEEYLTYFPQYSDEIKECENKYLKVLSNIKKYTENCEKIWEKTKDKKSFALVIKDDEYSSFGFKFIHDKNLTPKELFDMVSLNSKRRLLENVDIFEQKNPSLNFDNLQQSR